MRRTPGKPGTLRRIGEAAELAGVTRKDLQNWYARGLLLPPERDGGHADYTGDQVLRLKLVVTLYEHGVPVPIADRLTNTAFDYLAKAEPDAADPLAAWRGKTLSVSNKDKSWHISLWDKRGFDRPATLLIDCHRLFGDVLARIEDEGEAA